ncbi:MAG: formylglycine-generating enzyme family protein [Planctomycetes bacterium]|nr:formylglycine-generating enzyme family protein [Planctomycetota bacterium]
MTNISFPDARRYAAWADKRLPTAEEWEHAARGIDQRDFPFGSLLDPDACNAATGILEAVGTLTRDRSPYGIHDLAGNVAEWIASSSGETAEIRGGSFELPRYRAIAAAFERRRADDSYSDVGFRCARSLP